MNSENYLKMKLPEFADKLDGKGYFLSVDELFEEKNKVKLRNAVNNISNGDAEPAYIVGVIDVSWNKSAKTGILFTGTTIYIHRDKGQNQVIDLRQLQSVNFEEKTINDDNKTQKVRVLKYVIEDNEVEIKDTENEFPLEELAEILNGILNETDSITSTEQNLTLNQLSDEAILSYLKFVEAYYSEYRSKEKAMRTLASLMASIGLTPDNTVSEEFQKYRLDNIKKPTSEELFSDLKENIPEGSREEIFASIIDNLVLIKDVEELDNWKNDQSLLDLANKLNVDERQIEFSVRNAKNNLRILKEPLTDDDISEMKVQLVRFGSSVGASLGALLVTGGAVGAFGETAIITISTGGLAAAAIGIGAASVAAYKGVEYLTTTDAKTKYQMRIDFLNKNIKKLNDGQGFLLQDINYLMDKLAGIMDSKDALQAKYDQAKVILKRAKMRSNAAKAAQRETSYMEREALIAKLPTEINPEKVHDLVQAKSPSQRLETRILANYEPVTDEEKNDVFYLKPTITTEEANQLADDLIVIEYNKLASAANVKQVVKKENLKQTADNIKDAVTADKLKQTAHSSVEGAKEFIKGEEVKELKENAGEGLNIMKKGAQKGFSKFAKRFKG